MRRVLLAAFAILALTATAAVATPPNQRSVPIANPVARTMDGVTAGGPDARAVIAQFPDTPSQDNLGRVIYNHFGNPSAGQALIETWIRQTYDDGGLPLTVQGFASASRVHNVSRVAIRVVLHTDGGTNDDNATGLTCNNGNQAANPRIFNCTSPTISAGYNPGTNTTQFCEAWTTVHYAIRWTDGTLSSGKSLTTPSRLFSDRCYFLGGP